MLYKEVNQFGADGSSEATASEDDELAALDAEEI